MHLWPPVLTRLIRSPAIKVTLPPKGALINGACHHAQQLTRDSAGAQQADRRRAGSPKPVVSRTKPRKSCDPPYLPDDHASVDHAVQTMSKNCAKRTKSTRVFRTIGTLTRAPEAKMPLTTIVGRFSEETTDAVGDGRRPKKAETRNAKGTRGRADHRKGRPVAEE